LIKPSASKGAQKGKSKKKKRLDRSMQENRQEVFPLSSVQSVDRSSNRIGQRNLHKNIVSMFNRTETQESHDSS